MVQQDEPDDYCIATGVQFSVSDFVDFSWGHLGKAIGWEGEGMDEKAWVRRAMTLKQCDWLYRLT
jgi:GDPmannose 4,6-dehydratase